MDTIGRKEAKRMLDAGGVTVVEVLEERYFNKFHLPGAINVPLDADFDRRIQEAVPDKDQPVLVYCMDEQCLRSPQAAERMDALGYSHVYDYAAGKMDWCDAGLPVEL